ncbi:hypothetical protein FZC79_13120 [Rossellomorea vietnamensis]|uniref:Uncharacterized protein n=1 Tax=Rossellomorea vietnamensis TaxID=218284 RepID=A0A5D4KEZ0_9BACI|nr:hypothetical protein FZC79_13120 [Rossellomorea vietnamensis]
MPVPRYSLKVCKKSASALISPDRHMFPGEKKAVFPFIHRGLFDPEGLGAGSETLPNLRTKNFILSFSFKKGSSPCFN